MVTGTDAYYYVDGSQVPLEPAGEVAVDLNAAASSAQVTAGAIERLEKNGRALRDGVVTLPVSEVSGGLAETLDAAGALHPVFAGGGGKVVVLPEVRIETDTEDQAARVRDYLKGASDDLEVVRDYGERMVIRPASGRGADALDLANRVEEAAHPAMAQARFLRIVPRA